MSLFDVILKALPNRKPSEAPISPSMSWSGQKTNVVTYNNIVAAEMALQHPVIFRCLNKIATSVSTVDWKCVPIDDVPASERATVTTIKNINNVLRSPNDILSATQLKYWMGLNYAVYGRVPFLVGISSDKSVNAVHALDTKYVKVITSERGFATHYEYGNASDGAQGGKVYPTRRTAERGTGTSSYVHEVFTPNLTGIASDCRSLAPLSAAGLPAAIITLLLKRGIDTASGHPNSKYVIVAEKTLTKDQKKNLESYIAGSSVENGDSGHALFLYNTKIDVHELPSDLSDLHTKMPMDDMSRMIYGLFGIPSSLMGISSADGAKFAGNYVESRRSFWEDTIIPNYLSPIADGLTDAICPSGCRIEFDIDSIPALQEVRSSTAERVSKVTFLTDDEKRELCGFPKMTEEQRLLINDGRKDEKTV